MNKKGFTLAELMGVVIILGVILTITLPTVDKIIKNAKETSYNTQIASITKAASDWALQNTKLLPDNDGESIVIYLGTLKQNGSVSVNIENPKTGAVMSNSTSITITKVGNSYTYLVNVIDLTTTEDSNAPLLIISGDLVDYVEVSQSGTTYTIPSATATTSSGIAIDSSNITYTITKNGVTVSNVDTTKLGTYEIHYTVTNDNHTGNYQKTVIVRDTTAPVLNVGDNIVCAINGLPTDLTSGVTVTDNSGEVITPIVRSTISKLEGTYYIYYTATDSSGNSITKRKEVTVLSSIGAIVLAKFPYLELGSNGCKTNTSGTNYTYMGGCYLAGKRTDNYVWYSGFVWRIMGINSDNSVRMITEENETTIPYDNDSSLFKGSHAEDWLNNYFYSHLKNTSIITNGNWCERGTNYVTSNTSNSTTCVGTTINDKVGFVSLDEYNLASGRSSYLVNSQYFWTLTPYDSSHVWYAYYNGDAGCTIVYSTNGLRPVINVNSTSSITSGNGTLSDSYILGETKGTNVTGNLKDIATSGEYVTLANKTYRVVSIDGSGNTKLILDGYYEETAGTNYKMIYGSTSTFDTTTTTGVGYKLNNDVLNWLIPSSDTTNRNKLVTYNWYQNNFNDGNSYTVSLNETNPTRTISATVGLIRVGEMLSDQSLTILNKNNTVTNSYSNTATYWTMTPYTSSSRAWNVSSYGNALNDFDSGSSTFGLRPVIVVNSSATITSGNGTQQSPY